MSYIGNAFIDPLPAAPDARLVKARCAIRSARDAAERANVLVLRTPVWSRLGQDRRSDYQRSLWALDAAQHRLNRLLADRGRTS